MNAAWLKLSTANFTLYTDAGEQQGREAVLAFERVRSFFLASSSLKDQNPTPVRIVAFQSASEYRPYSNNQVSDDYYTHDPDRDYIVMSDLAPEHFPAVIHEYTHLALEHSGLKLPLWLEEGWADLNSTLKSKGKKAMVGDLIPGRVRTLEMGLWIPLTALDKVGHDSPLYNERDKAGMFYAESWALTHMLFLSPQYRKQFPAVARSVASGKSLAETSETVLGKPIGDLEKDLRKYLDRHNLAGAVFPVDLRKEEEETNVSPVSDFEARLMLADLLGVVHRFDASRNALEQLRPQYPKRAELDEALGYLNLRTGDVDEARRQFQAAIADGSTNAPMCYRLGLLSPGNDLMNDRISAFRRAVELKPDYDQARLALGLALIDTKDFQGSLQQLKQIRKVTEFNAPWYFSAVALDEVQLGANADARKNATEAKKWAKTAAQTRQADQLLQYLDSKETSASGSGH